VPTGEIGLAAGEHYRALVLTAWTVLREQTRPRSRVAVQLEVRPSPAVLEASAPADGAADLVGRHHLQHRLLGLFDDAGMDRVEDQSQLEDVATVSRDAPVSQIETEKVGVFDRQLGESVLGTVAGLAS